MKDHFWEQPEVVDQFAAREPDHRLRAMVPEYAEPSSVRVLDLGCAGGRNTVFLAERGFDVQAVDASEAMVRRTRERLADLLGADEAARRVRTGPMDDLSAFGEGAFDLVVALGIYHNARSVEEWERAVAETARVLKPGGRLLVNHFTPEVDLTGEGVTPVAGVRNLYEGFPGGRAVLLDAASLDAAMRRHGLETLVPSVTVTAATDKGRRVSVNALYERTALR
jgi:SAM-dependent methyltransferase